VGVGKRTCATGSSLAIRDTDVRALFCKPDPTSQDLATISLALRAALPAAEDRLDALAAEAKWEARKHAADPATLMALIDYTRELSRR
jgi:hypothetical protein